jgi:hypothetical protein
MATIFIEFCACGAVKNVWIADGKAKLCVCRGENLRKGGFEE